MLPSMLWAREAEGMKRAPRVKLYLFLGLINILHTFNNDPASLVKCSYGAFELPTAVKLFFALNWLVLALPPPCPVRCFFTALNPPPRPSKRTQYAGTHNLLLSRTLSSAFVEIFHRGFSIFPS